MVKFTYLNDKTLEVMVNASDMNINVLSTKKNTLVALDGSDE